jgi:hypothetical protein
LNVAAGVEAMPSLEPADAPTLPQLEPGVTLLTTDGRARGALQSLALDHVLLEDSTAVWVDSKHNAATTSLAKVAPSRRLLGRIRVARAFTAFQHYSLVEDLPAAVDETTSLVVVPAVEWFYANDDLCEGEGATMLARALEGLRDLAAERELPVLVSVRSECGIGGDVEAYCDERLECVATRFGPRFSGETFETLLFDCEGGVQTTLAFWRRVLEERHSTRLPDDATGVTPVGSH